jgi:3-phytase
MKSLMQYRCRAGTALLFFALAGACVSGPDTPAFPTVTARVETRAVRSAEDAADDPAIWVHPVNPLQSLVLGTDKQNGMMVYNLLGQEVQYIPRGRLNNVDIRQQVKIGNEFATFAVATNRTHKAIDIFRVSPTGIVSFVMAQPVSLSDPYGICMYLDDSGLAHVFANSTDGSYQHWLLNPEHQLKPVLQDSFMLDSQPEGCAADDATGMLYIGEEDVGIWYLPVADISRALAVRQSLDVVTSPYLHADIEGMDVWRRGETANLVASSQGNNSFAVYDLGDHSYRGSFRIADTADRRIDGVQETDGLTVSSVQFGNLYPEGLLVVQDGYNKLPEDNQNFKLVSWQQVLDALEHGKSPQP